MVRQNMPGPARRICCARKRVRSPIFPVQREGDRRGAGTGPLRLKVFENPRRAPECGSRSESSGAIENCSWGYLQNKSRRPTDRIRVYGCSVGCEWLNVRESTDKRTPRQLTSKEVDGDSRQGTALHELGAWRRLMLWSRLRIHEGRNGRTTQSEQKLPQADCGGRREVRGAGYG